MIAKAQSCQLLPRDLPYFCHIAIYCCYEVNNTELTTFKEWEALFKEVIEYDFVVGVRPREKVDAFVSLAADVLCGYSPTYRINNADVPLQAVRDRLLSLDEDNMLYAIDVMDDISWQVTNIRSYMLNVLYNAPCATEAYNQALFNRTFKMAE